MITKAIPAVAYKIILSLEPGISTSRLIFIKVLIYMLAAEMELFIKSFFTKYPGCHKILKNKNGGLL